ncbi:MotA/TolQ/ExbB proton channel family protein [Penaeicola halotolerans]|uniref:MotA/TolQ/ExbB proton channel family protein n=1 Tax=Penaeicola halotolerans TaxID=2793196 RepID=UPI001CF8FAE5|nr:MotA/TolQ/ExbB proton channel family protein [Penaeicola halotolerans]
MILLQAISTFQADSTMVEGAGESLSVLELLLKGGYFIIPLALLWLVAIYIFFERMLTLKKAAKTSPQFLDQVKSLVQAGDVNGARLLCSQENSPVSKMISKGISRIGSPLKNIEVAIENVGKVEINRLEKNLSTLATIAGAAPMIGFLGTVTGMIQAFIAIAQEEGSVSPKLLSTGIYEAMITTATGLVVGILAYLGYNYLVTQVQKLIHSMEYATIEFVDLLQDSK